MIDYVNGDQGIDDFADILAEGGQVIEPLRDWPTFAKAFISLGVPSWPTGLQLDPTDSHMELVAQGRIHKAVAAE